MFYNFYATEMKDENEENEIKPFENMKTENEIKPFGNIKTEDVINLEENFFRPLQRIKKKKYDNNLYKKNKSKIFY